MGQDVPKAFGLHCELAIINEMFLCESWALSSLWDVQNHSQIVCMQQQGWSLVVLVKI